MRYNNSKVTPRGVAAVEQSYFHLIPMPIETFYSSFEHVNIRSLFKWIITNLIQRWVTCNKEIFTI